MTSARTEENKKIQRIKIAIAGAVSAVALAICGLFAFGSSASPENIVMDDYVAEHVPDRISQKIISASDAASPAAELRDTGERVRTRTLVVDASKVGANDTIEDVYAGTDDEKIDKILYQSESLSTVYDYGDPDNYVAYLDVSGDNTRTQHPQDVVFAYDTVDGEVIDSPHYDENAGLAYIPKSLFTEERVVNRAPGTQPLQAQTLVRYDLSHAAQAYEQDKSANVVGEEPALGDLSRASVIPVTVNTDSGSVSKMAQVPVIGNQFAVAVLDEKDAKSVSVSDIMVDINDGAVKLDGSVDDYEPGYNLPSVSYDEDAGTVNMFNVSPQQVMNATVTVRSSAEPSASLCAALATAGEIVNPTDAAYSIGHWDRANCTGYGWAPGSAPTKTLRRYGPGESVRNFLDITANDISDQTCRYGIAIGGCPSSLGSYWTANGGTSWQANCVHAKYPSGNNPPSGGYYKVLAADWNNQTVTLAFLVTCDSGGQEGGIVLSFYAPRNGIVELYKKANANPYLGSAWKPNVSGAVFGVYNNESSAKAGGNSGLVKTLTSNSAGVASGSFDDGKYWVKELSAPWPYLVSDQIVTFTAKPKSKDRATFYDDTVPPIQFCKKIVPSGGSSSESNISAGGVTDALHVSTVMSADRTSVTTVLEATRDVGNVTAKNSSPSALSNPSSNDEDANVATDGSMTIANLKAGQSVTIEQNVKKGGGWTNRQSLATICSVSVDGARVDMSLPLLANTLAGTTYGVYSDSACARKLGDATLDANGVGYYGTHQNEWLYPNTTYYVREIAGANGYSASDEVYPVTTKRNSQSTVNVTDSFSTLKLAKHSGAGKSLTDKLPQFSLKGAKYGIFTDYSKAEAHDVSGVINTADGRQAVMQTDEYGNATEVALGVGTYYVAELPSSITRPWQWGQQSSGDMSEPADIDAEIASHDYKSKSNGQFMLDENVYTISTLPGATTVQVSEENIPVRLQLSKQSSRSDLLHLSQFSLEGAVFGVYETKEAAQSAPTGHYKEEGFFPSYDGAVAFLYGNADGTTTVSWDLPLKDYYIKEIRAPKNYKLGSLSFWVMNGEHVDDEILHVTPGDFMSSGRYIDGVLANSPISRANEPADVTVQVRKDSSEVPDSMKNAGNAMSLAGARFAIYQSFADAQADRNRMTFNTDEQEEGAPKVDLLVSAADGLTNKATGLRAEECYWVREIEPPHAVSDDPAQNAKNIAESMYVLDSEPVKASFTTSDEIDMLAYKDDVVKPVSITVGKYAMSMDTDGHTLHVGEKDANGVPYNDAYTGDAFAGAIFGLFSTRADAERAPVADDVNDVSVEQSAYAVGAIAIMTSNENGICGTVDNLKWKPDGYYVKELKAPTSGCYKRNESVLQVGCDRNTKDSEHIWCDIDANKVSKHFEVDEMPEYYYVKIEKTSSVPDALAHPEQYNLEGIHFGIYKTREEAAAATEENPGAPLYNLYTKKVTHDDGSVHYEAVSGLTGPGTFWAKELIADDAVPNGFQKLDSPIMVEAHVGDIPRYDATPITPENSAPTVDKTTGQLSYKTAKDIDDENVAHPTDTFSSERQHPNVRIDVPTGAFSQNFVFTSRGNKSEDGMVSLYNQTDGIGMTRYSVTIWGDHVSIPYTRFTRVWSDSAGNLGDTAYSSGTLYSSYSENGWMIWPWGANNIEFFTSSYRSGSNRYQDVVKFYPVASAGYYITGMSITGGFSYGAANYVHSNKTIWIYTSANTYSVSFNGNAPDAGNVSSAKNVTYNSNMPSVAKPTRKGYIFQGYYDAVSGGTQYYKADGTSARAWDKAGNGTLYAHWTPITYTVKYTSTDPDAKLTPGMTGASKSITVKYAEEKALESGLFHKFGWTSTSWKYTADDGTTKYLTPPPNGTSKILNLTAVNGKEVVLTAVWNLNEYLVKFNDGLSQQWGPAPVVESGTNPDTSTPWSLGYQQRLYYDDYASDGITSDNLTSVRYSHPYFAFNYWVDAEGNKYNDMQAVQNLAMPGNTKELTGVWYPAFDYGVDCEANIIVNAPVGGITIQKTVKSDSDNLPDVLQDLSGIEFALFTDQACTNRVAISVTDTKGVATFSDVESGNTYYVTEQSIPSRLEHVMTKSEEVKAVEPGALGSYEFENECEQTTVRISKVQSPYALWNIKHPYLTYLSPDGAKFAVYASKQDAAADVNRLPFYDENGHVSTVATTSDIADDNGLKVATVTLSGLPNQGLWIQELTAPDHGMHEFVAKTSPTFASEEVSDISDDGKTLLVEVPNEVRYATDVEFSKTIDDASLSNVPKALKDYAQKMTDGITYAIYANKMDAARRASNYLELVTVQDGKIHVSNVPFGSYYLIEWSLPEAAQKAGIVRSDKVSTLNVSDNVAAPNFADAIATSKLHLRKVDADTNAPISGVVFDIYEDDSKSTLLCSMSATDSMGYAVSSTELIPGRSYFVQERYDTMPAEYNGQGVGSDTSWSGWVEVTLESVKDNAVVVKNSKNDETGDIEVRKSSKTSADLSGAVFSVYDSTGALYTTMTTDASGIAHANGIPVGHYTVKETTALPLHSFTDDGTDAETFEGVVYPNSCWNVNGGVPVTNYQGYVKVHKQSANKEITEQYPDIYSLAGAVYSIYPITNGIVASTPLSATIVTDVNGESEPVAVPIGSYKLVETTEPVNYSTPAEDKEIRVDITMENETPESAAIAESIDTPNTASMADFVVEKRSAETYAVSDGSPQGATSMANTKFVIEYSPALVENYEEALAADKAKKWVVATDSDGRATFDKDSIISDESGEIHTDKNGNAVLPAGTIVVREIVPPTGYTIGKAPTAAYVFNGATDKFSQLMPDGEEDLVELDGAPTFTAANNIYRADISFTKKDAYDEGKVMKDIPFLLTLLDKNGEPIERHLIATDDTGRFSSATGSLEPVNANDAWIPGDVERGIVLDSFAPTDSRVWFSGSRVEVEPSAGKGALIYGDYELREYSKNDTVHYQSLEPIYFSVRGDNEESWVEMNGERVPNGDLDAVIGNVKNHSIHIENTELLDNATKAHTVGNGNLNATESVTFADATVGEKYIFETLAFDADTGEAITRTFEDVDGEMAVTQAGGAYTLEECKAAGGEISIPVSFEDYDVTDRKIALVTKVYHNGYLSDTHNADLKDDMESVSFASMKTTATDSDTGQHVGNSDGHVEITDVISYKNLVPGTEYVADGTLMDKATGNPLRDAHGQVVTGQTKFTPAERNGTVAVVFSFDADYNTPFTVVAFEKVSLGGVVVMTHEEVEDVEQAVAYPSAVTTARDAVTGTFQGNAEGETVTVQDKVAYRNLTPNREYELRGLLYVLDENGNKTAIAGSNATKTFTPVAANGEIEMSFTVKSSDVIGHRVLVGESIWSGGKIIAEHDDAAFEDQIVSYPFVSTEAFDVASGSHVGNGEKDTTLTDIVYLTGLKPGETYRIDGTIMARDASGAATATSITTTETFTAASANEEHRLSYTVPESFLQEDAVVFERLSSSGGTHLLATHEQANDDRQSVHYPRISTIAISPNGETHVGSNIDNKIVDTVAYQNVVPGYLYEVVGMLVYKDTGAFVTEPGATEPIVSSTMFVPQSDAGTVEIPFEVKDVDVAGRTLVVFEQLFVVPAENTPASARTLIATHCDIDDAQQSMFYPRIRTIARDKDNGTHVGSSVVPSAVIDTVEYENLVPGLEYEVHGILMDKDSGEPVTVGSGDDARTVTAQVSFVPSERNGSVDVPFETLSPEVTHDRTFVAYEKLLLKSFSMAEHENLEDAEQSVSYPKVMTSAKDAETLLHEGYVDSMEDGYEDDIVTVIDTVEYSHLVPGREYKVVGKLVDKYEFVNGCESSETDKSADDYNVGGDGSADSSTDSPFMDGDKRTSVSDGETVFTPKTENGTVEVKFEMKKSAAYGHVFVAFERLQDSDGHVVAHHEEIDDEVQTVSYPKISTSVRDSKTDTRAGSNESISVIDTVSYEGLLEGHEYVVTGTLMDKATGEPVTNDDGINMTGETRFEAGNHGAGDVDVVFESAALKELLEGKTLVVFERIMEAPLDESDGDADENEGVEDGAEDVPSSDDMQGDDANVDNDTGDAISQKTIASHEDIDDESQSIHYPKIRTHAENKDGSKMIPFESDAHIIDTVAYENLVPGVEYVLDGVMMNKQASRELYASGAPVTASKAFTPDGESGTVEVEFAFDGTDTETCVAVAFETLTANGTEVAEHRDIDDEDQSVYVAGVADDLIDLDTPLALIPLTADGITKMVILLIAVAFVGAGTMVVRRRRR